MQETAAVKISKIFTVTGVILVVFMLAIVWSIPKPSSDLQTALAAGKDILSGHWNTPDTWSFSTGGRVWINQNWGASVILYLVQSLAGEPGLLAAKFALLGLCALFLILALRALKIPLGIGLLIGAAVTGCLNIYTTLRPNLFTITFIALELWLLYKTLDRPFLVWIVVLIISFWANIHGGFVFGLGMLCLWTACVLIPEVVKQRWQVLKNRWQFLAAVSATFLLAGLANPFGLTNLTFPLLMMQGSVWNSMLDWLPVWATQFLASFISGISTFLVISGILLLLLIIRLCHIILKYFKPRRQQVREKADFRVILFDAILAAVAVIMAVRSNRFIAIALLALTPLLARQVQWLLGSALRQRILLAVFQCCLFAYGVVMVMDNIRNYNPANPLLNTGPGTFFERMHWVNTKYDPGIVRFINTNRISGNVFSPWQWEGYLRWNCPQLKVFIGGRAQQVYSEKTFNQYLYLTGTQVNSLRGEDPVDVLRATNAHLLITGNSGDYYNLFLTALQSGNWVIVYADECCLLFADTNWPATAQIARQFAAGQLIFDNPAAAAMSQAAFIFSQPAKWKTDNIMELFTAAFSLNPTWLWSYNMLFTYFQYDALLFSRVTDLFNRQLTLLEKLSLDGADAADILSCRIALSDMLGTLAKQLHQEEAAARMTKSNSTAKQLFSGLKARWKQWIIK